MKSMIKYKHNEKDIIQSVTQAKATRKNNSEFPVEPMRLGPSEHRSGALPLSYMRLPVEA